MLAPFSIKFLTIFSYPSSHAFINEILSHLSSFLMSFLYLFINSTIFSFISVQESSLVVLLSILMLSISLNIILFNL